jgi:signal peptidase I
MDKPNSSKVAIDSSVREKVPTVAVASETPEPETEEVQPPKKSILEIIFRHAVTLVMDFLETIVVAMSIFVVVYLLLVQPHEVKGSSMEQTFHNNDYILTDKISYRFRHPQRGEVIIFKAPNNQEVDYIKRVIGLPGERVKVEKGHVFVNDVQIPEPYLHDVTLLFPGSPLQEGVDFTVPGGNYFVMGDNRPHSSDSREFGPVPQNLIIGRAFFRYWPLNVAGLIHKANYPSLN